jgi:hypothetical protein
MSITLLTPLGLLLALGALPPLLAFAAVEGRARRVRRVLEIGQPPARVHVPAIAALLLVPCLLAVALAQPVIRFSETHRVRTDAEAFYIVDVSRSMRAAADPGAPTRFERAVAAAQRLHGSLPEVPSGVATLTDRVLPNLFPTADEEVFAATVERALAPETPPPRGYETVGTLFAAFDTLAGTNFFGEGVKHRLAVVLTDGESAPFDAAALRDALAEGPPTKFVVIRFWQPDERVWQGEQPERDYRPDPSSGRALRRLASATGARTFQETELGGAARAARELLATGPLREEGSTLRAHALSRWFAVAALVPLALLLWRRNVI